MIEKLKRVHKLIEDLSMKQTASLLNRTEIAVIIEALQMKKDLETLCKPRREMRLYVLDGGYLAGTRSLDTDEILVSKLGDTIPKALRLLAAKVIEKGG